MGYPFVRLFALEFQDLLVCALSSGFSRIGHIWVWVLVIRWGWSGRWCLWARGSESFFPLEGRWYCSIQCEVRAQTKGSVGERLGGGVYA